MDHVQQLTQRDQWRSTLAFVGVVASVLALIALSYYGLVSRPARVEATQPNTSVAGGRVAEEPVEVGFVADAVVGEATVSQPGEIGFHKLAPGERVLPGAQVQTTH